MHSLKALGLVTAVLAAAPAAAELPVSPLIDIYQSYNDCFKVATKEGLKPGVLATLGWQRATMTDKDNKPIAGGPTIFGNLKRKPVIFLSAEKSGVVCTVVARLESVAAFNQFKQAWGGKLPAPDKDGMIGFIAEGQPVLLRQTGTADKPSLSISVMTQVEEK